MDLSKQHQMNLLCCQTSTIGELELLRLHYEKVQQRSLNEIIEYTCLIQSRTLFTDDVLTAAIGIGQFVGKGNTIKQKCLDWIAKYTADVATALFVAHTAKNVSGYIYKMVDRYLKEVKKKIRWGKRG